MVFGFIVMVIGTGLSIEQVMDTSSTNRTLNNCHILNQDSILSGHFMKFCPNSRKCVVKDVPMMYL